ncbi:MAG TPA: methionine--tRNA ligase [Elusimicrobia bacterium]|nr:MAG: methionine--tRNA ligase [Elusimicrobia bacterium GWA2_66_18]OGR70557.1 MAG: methionine--tRNA ligase [Elusimicrobia bacterium GWC2_65_9]HAZ07669.1 methionine--tRNA ligase [Elusimicrobiota bacterium]
MKKYYITTPLYYVNAAPHIGHAYTTIAADVLARFQRGRGIATHLLTGTDEHGQKIEDAAKASGKHSIDFCDAVSGKFRDLWKRLDIQYDDYIRTTEKRHEDKVQELFALLMKNGDIVKGRYEGLYDVVSESYVKEADAVKGPNGVLLSPDSGKPLQKLSEETYFFKLSKFGPRLLAHYRDNPGFLAPSNRALEIVRFVSAGLEDISVSRAKVKWGIPVPGDPDHTVYVWFDALINYWSATAGADDLWPADVHIVGKEIYRFHAVIWPAILMAAGLPLPKKVFAHGWWTVDGRKMSKSLSNFVDPCEITQEFGVDALRYFLLREMPFGNDGDFSKASLTKRYNAELANDLGNLVSRVAEMVDKFLGGRLPTKPPLSGDFYTTVVAKRTPEIAAKMEELDFHGALNAIWGVIREINARVNEKAPWKLAKDDMAQCELVLFDLVWSLRLVSGWIDPFMPHTAAKIHMQLGVRQFPDSLTAEDVLSGVKERVGLIQKGPVLFPRKA